jgi:hypothetical protein
MNEPTRGRVAGLTLFATGVLFLTGTWSPPRSRRLLALGGDLLAHRRRA